MNEVSYIVDTTLKPHDYIGIRILISNLRPPLMKIISTPLEKWNNFFFFFFFKLLPKYSDFINSDDWIGKTTSKYIKLMSSFYSKKDLNWIISSEKMKNSGNNIYHYAHSFFGKDFPSEPIHWSVNHYTCNNITTFNEISSEMWE